VQQRLLEVFGIERVALVCGFSMGAQQAFHWAALFPDRVERDRADLRFGQDLGPQFRFSRRR
jgi:homoserine acetyltransferase